MLAYGCHLVGRRDGLIGLAMAAATCLCGVLRADEPTLVRSAKSGAWSEPSTWEAGKVPAAGVKVQIREGHTVTYDVQSPEALVIRSLHIAGTLTFAPDKSTQLNAGLVKIEAGDSTEDEGFESDGHIEVV